MKSHEIWLYHFNRIPGCSLDLFFIVAGFFKDIHICFTEHLMSSLSPIRMHSNSVLVVSAEMSYKMSICLSMFCQLFQNPKAPRPLGRRWWNLAYVFYGLWDKTSRKWNLEFWLLCRTGHPKLSRVGRDRLSFLVSILGDLSDLHMEYGWNMAGISLEAVINTEHRVAAGCEQELRTCQQWGSHRRMTMLHRGRL